MRAANFVVVLVILIVLVAYRLFPAKKKEKGKKRVRFDPRVQIWEIEAVGKQLPVPSQKWTALGRSSSA